jgi:hypothetical protein
VTLARSSYARIISGPVGTRTIGNASRSATADRNRRAVRSPERQRRRSTETVSTSTRSGADHCEAAAIRTRATRPADPSSPTALATIDASSTINGRHAPRRGRRRLDQGRHAHRADERFVRARRPWRASTPTSSVQRPETVAATAPPHGHGAEGSRARHLADRVPTRLACLHSAITPPAGQPWLEGRGHRSSVADQSTSDFQNTTLSSAGP